MTTNMYRCAIALTLMVIGGVVSMTGIMISVLFSAHHLFSAIAAFGAANLSMSSVIIGGRAVERVAKQGDNAPLMDGNPQALRLLEAFAILFVIEVIRIVQH